MTGTTESFRERIAFEDPTDREHQAETPSSVMHPEGGETREAAGGERNRPGRTPQPDLRHGGTRCDRGGTGQADTAPAR